jgi:ectonucleotide pyrophosphatase/phosphodiesterase family member 5
MHFKMNRIFNRLKSIYFVLVIVLSVSLAGCLQKSDPYVLLVSFDGFRWDYPDRNITPNLSKFISEGVRAETLRPSFPTKTFPNHYSIVTGLYPENHGIIMNRFRDPETGDIYTMSDTASLRDPKWYKGEPVWSTLKRQGIRTASFFWPGSEVHDPNKRPDYFKIYQHNLPYGDRIDGIINWLSLPLKERPRFITLYFHETDSRGHESGPESPETNAGIALLDSLFGVMLNKIEQLPIADQVNIIIVSDHGMTEVSQDKVININELLPGIDIESWGSGPLMMLNPHDNQQIYDNLKQKEQNFKIYKKADVPARLHFSQHPAIWPLVLIADPGYSLTTDWGYKRIMRNPNSGNHGYDNELQDMQGIFIAGGPAFKKGLKIKKIDNVDIYPLICKIFNVKPTKNIDGHLERVVQVLQ